MRAYQWLAAAVVVVAFAAPARAQLVNMGQKTNGPIVYNVINPSASAATTIAPQQTGLFSTSKLAGHFHWPTPPSNMQTIGTSNFPPASAMPGPGYLQQFGYTPPPQPPGPIRTFFAFFGL
jgi:hypothetical protein